MMVGVINYHLFRFMVPVAAHKQLNKEFDSLKKLDTKGQAELSTISTRVK